jgi:hypothetical protein
VLHGLVYTSGRCSGSGCIAVLGATGALAVLHSAVLQGILALCFHRGVWGLAVCSSRSHRVQRRCHLAEQQQVTC